MILGYLKTGIPEQNIKLPFREKDSKARSNCRTKGLPAIKKYVLDEDWSRNIVASDGLIFCARGHAQAQKKAGRFPIREDEGPAKNLLVKRQKNAQQDTKAQWSLLVYFIFTSKSRISNLAGSHLLLLKIPM